MGPTTGGSWCFSCYGEKGSMISRNMFPKSSPLKSIFEDFESLEFLAISEPSKIICWSFPGQAKGKPLHHSKPRQTNRSLRSHAYGAARGSPGIGTCGKACSAWPDGWRRQTGLHAWRSAPTLARRMSNGAVVFGRERGFTTFGKVFGRVSCREFSRQSALQGEAPDEERQQAEQHKQ